MELTQEKIDELMDDMLKIASKTFPIRATIPYRVRTHSADRNHAGAGVAVGHRADYGKSEPEK